MSQTGPPRAGPSRKGLEAFLYPFCQINSRAQISSSRGLLPLRSREGHKRYQDIATACDRIYGSENSPFITTLQYRTVTKFTKVESIFSDENSLRISELQRIFFQQRRLSILPDTSFLFVAKRLPALQHLARFSCHN